MVRHVTNCVGLPLVAVLYLLLASPAHARPVATQLASLTITLESKSIDCVCQGRACRAGNIDRRRGRFIPLYSAKIKKLKSLAQRNPKSAPAITKTLKRLQAARVDAGFMCARHWLHDESSSTSSIPSSSSSSSSSFDTPRCNTNGICEEGENLLNCSQDCTVCEEGQTRECINSSLFGACLGQQLCHNNAWQTCRAPTPVAERCGDGVDNNCDGAIDEHCTLGLETDQDMDGLPDDWERYYFMNLEKTASDDVDGDGLSNADEVANSTNPVVADSDFDEIPDGDEVHNRHTNPLNPDTDGDGLSDKEESTMPGRDPLVRAPFQYVFEDEKGTHVRTQDGVKVTDSIDGRLDLIPWMYFVGNIDIPPIDGPARTESFFEILKDGAEYWADAGATAIGVVMSPERLDDENLSVPGYQNHYVDELLAIGARKNIRMIFGIQMGGTGADLLDPTGTRYINYGKILDDVVSYTGLKEFFVEQEWPIRVHLVPYFLQGAFAFDATGFNRIRDNYARFLRPGVLTHFWIPALFVKNDGSLYTSPPPYNSDPNYYQNEVYKYVMSQVYTILDSILGENFSENSYQSNSYFGYYSPRFRYGPYSQDSYAIKVFKKMQEVGRTNYQQFVNNWYPYRARYNKSGLYGPAETVLNLSRFYGRELDNSQFKSLSFNRVMLYPQNYFDMTGLAQREYQKNGVHLALTPEDMSSSPGRVGRGKRAEIIVSVFRDDGPFLFSVDAPSISGGSDSYSFKVLPSGKQAIFSWIPGSNRAGSHWITVKVTNGKGLQSEQPVQLTVY